MNLRHTLCHRLAVHLLDIRLRGVQPMSGAEGGVMVIANHPAPLDWWLLPLFLPADTLFVYDIREKRPPFVVRFYSWINWLGVDFTRPGHHQTLMDHLSGGGVAFAFPEGGATGADAIAKVAAFPLSAARKAGAKWIVGHLWGSRKLSFWHLLTRRRGIVLDFSSPDPAPIREKPEAPGMRQAEERLVGDWLVAAAFKGRPIHRTLWEGLIENCRPFDSQRVMLQEGSGTQATQGSFFTRTAILAQLLKKQTQPGERVGVLLPTTVGGLITFFALQLLGRTPTMLNFTAGPEAMAASARLAGVKTILSSRLFIEKAKLQAAHDHLKGVARVLLLEDLKKELNPWMLLKGFVTSRMPLFFHRRWSQGVDRNDPGVILFTSGSEGTPKGVVLSHGNLQANLNQIKARVDFNERDTLLNALPMFHAFGLTVGTLAPLFSGMKGILLPSPLDYRGVAETCYRTQSTILASANTFLAGYGKVAHPYDFHTLKLVFAGAEPLREETARLWRDKFGIRILEGYGATETSPVISVNTPMENLSGSVGRALPGMARHLAPVEGVDVGGRLWVKGENVMVGYLKEGAGREPIPPAGPMGKGWYDTGDVVAEDEAGYLQIVGRAKRFAKIGGEMVSLAAVEALAANTWPNERHAIITLPDPKKGERILILTERPNPDLKELIEQARKEHAAEILIPKRIIHIEEVPILGSGKIDFLKAREMVLELADQE
ncbi:MAG: AMP-binding protein [Magnetococcales bacterium]|nr:AMP-binding protein [Magnetococcales bacterium]